MTMTKLSDLQRVGQLVNNLDIRRAQLAALNNLPEGNSLHVKIEGHYAFYSVQDHAITDALTFHLKTDISDIETELKGLGIQP